jgi:hypothetical protein
VSGREGGSSARLLNRWNGPNVPHSSREHQPHDERRRLTSTFSLPNVHVSVGVGLCGGLGDLLTVGCR